MRFNFYKRQALLFLVNHYSMNCATAFLDMVLWSKYEPSRYGSAIIVLSPSLFRYLLRRDFSRLGISVKEFYSLHFDIDSSLHGFIYRVEFPSRQLSLF